ncbi:DNA-binding domain-containing protein [Devosia sp. FKR38]|uniref:HvfC/BufC N-terminal domain-containing protein n=1 Tax=Devosia sp. FKR38 TaxID=2562312 RepID=UPI0010C08380|nr:DNA-binding domain-containing protein [Devosia sp. FKR38]
MTNPPVGQSDFVAALVDPAKAVPPGIISHRGDSDAKRFAVYRNNVHVGLVGVLAAKYPVCRQLVGEAFFTAMARLYVADHKPFSPIMMLYGADFCDFIGGFAPAQSVPYLGDMAALEEAWSVAYHAADDSPLALAEIAAFDPEVLPDLTLTRHPATGLLRSAHPIGSIWSAHQAPGVPVRPGAEAVLITRPTLDVKVTAIPVADAAFAQDLLQGLPIGEAVERTLAHHSGFDFGRAIAGLCSLGAFSQAVLP